LKIRRAEIINGELALDLRVINRTGHKFPTGYPSRRAFLHVKVTDTLGQVLFESGRVRRDGRIIAVNADTKATAFEPHHKVIRHDYQVQVYEAVMGDTDNKVTYSLLRAAGYLKDNRIPPSGFDKSAVPEDIAVVGRARADNNFVGGSDIVFYRIPVPADTAVNVVAEVKYQSIGFATFQDLMASGDDPAITRFGDYFRAASNKTEFVARAKRVVAP
jgi:hypothetical protein